MLLYPMLEKLGPRQEDWLELSVAGFDQTDTAEHFSTSMSPEGLQEASDDLISKVGNGRIPLNDWNIQGTRVGCQEHVEKIL